jgi:ABC-type glycerol-3-phosphate transport system permease component
MMKRTVARKAAGTILLLIGAVIFVFPFYFMFMGSFKSNAEIFSMKVVSLPEDGFNLQYYIALFVESSFGRSLLNSTIVSVTFIVLIVFLSSLAGFAFAKYKFPGRDVLFIALLATIMLPPQVTYIPLFILITRMRWVSTYQALIVPRLLQGFGLAFSTFLMQQYMSYVPDEILNSARVDGCADFRIYRQIALPMVKSGLLVIGLIVFMDIWNDFTWPLIAVSRLDMYTVALNIARLFGTQRDVHWGQIMAACFMSSLPLIVIFLVFRKTFISGITTGAFK